MTIKEAKQVLHHPSREFVVVALSYVNLTDKELDVLILRHMRGHTQEEAAEELSMSVNGLQNIEKCGLCKCAKVWERLVYIKQIMNTAL